MLFIALSIANGSNYLFHVSVSRALGPSEYGALGSVLAILTVLTVPLTAIQATVARRISSRSAEARDWKAIIHAITPYAVALSALLALLSPLLRPILRLDSIATGLWVAIYVTPAILSAVLRGALQGRMRFGRLALVTLFPFLLRLVLGLAAVHGGLGVEGAVAASVISDFAGVVLALLVLGYSRRSEAEPVNITTFLREVAPVGLGLAATWVLIELDLVLARHFLPPEEAGTYAAAGLLARAVLFVPGAVSLIALPHFSQHSGRGKEAYRWLVASCLLVALLGIITCLLLTLASGFVVRLTFGDEYAGATELLPRLSLAMLGFGIVNLLIYFHIAANSRTYHLLWPVAAAGTAIVSISHESGTAIATVVLVLAWAVAALGFVISRGLALSIPGSGRLPRDVSLHPPRIGDGDPLEISIVVPTHNGGLGLVSTLDALVETLDSQGKYYEIIVVSDGSTDGTASRAASHHDRVGVIHYERRHGKGIALRAGMAQARGRYVAFIDADGELEAAEFRGFCALMDLYAPDLVIGSKRHPLSQVHYPWSRRVMSWTYHWVVRIMFGLNVRDTQTGMKLIRRDVLDAVLPRMLEKRFAFDLEFLVVARRLGYTRVFEAPIKLNYRFESTVSARATLFILIDTAAIFYRRYVLRFYDHPHTSLKEAESTQPDVAVDLTADERVSS
jgi:O-antigen/teichoic acid export membrane protein